MASEIMHNKQKNQQLPSSKVLTMANLIPFMKKSFPELEAAIFELEQDESLRAESDYEQFVFSFVFNPFLKNFLTGPSNFTMGERLFLFLEEMAQSFDWRVKHILALNIFGALNPEELTIAKKHMGPKTTLKSISIWDKEEFEKRMRAEGIKFVCSCYGKQIVDELEWKLNFKYDPDTRSFMEEIGSVTIEGTTINIANAGHSLMNPTKDTLEGIMYFAGLYYVLHKDGSIKAYNDSDSNTVQESYISLAHLIEEVIKNIQVTRALAQSYRALARQKLTSLIRRNRPKLTVQQKDAFLKKIETQQIDKQDSLDLGRFITERLPELPEDLDNWSYAFGWDDYAAEHDYYQELLNEVLTPFVIVFLNQDPGDVMVGRHLFYVLEKMAEAPHLKNKFALTVLESLSTDQLAIAKKYIRPKTKELLKDLEDYLEELFKKNKSAQ